MSDYASQPGAQVLTTLRKTGIPPELLPSPSQHTDRYEIVEGGERNLETRPFDYRNPYPLTPLAVLNSDQHNGSDTQAAQLATDGGEEFDYFLNGRAAIGLPGGPECALIDIYGTVRAFTGAWGFGIGDTREAPQVRHRRLKDGPVPEVTATTTQSELRCDVSYLAAPGNEPGTVRYPVEIGGSYEWIGSVHPSGPNMFLVIHGAVTNCGTTSMHAALTSAFMQNACLCAGAHWKRGVFAPPWEGVALATLGASAYRLQGSSDGTAYTLGILRLKDCTAAQTSHGLCHWPPPFERGAHLSAELSVELSAHLAPNASMEFEWLIPYFPLATQDEGTLAAWRRNDLRDAAAATWAERRAGRMTVAIPEAKVQHAFDQAANHLDLCAVTLDSTQFPTPGPSGGYHRFFEQDGNDQIHAFDILGDHARAEIMMRHYLLYPLDQSSCGMILRLYGKHLALTGNVEWARTIYGDACRRVSWLMGEWARSGDGLLPVSELDDNERIVGKYVSYHVYTLAGLKGAIAVASALNDGDLARQWREFHDLLHDAVFAKFADLVQKTDGVLTPGFDGFEQETVKIRQLRDGVETFVECSGSYGARGGIDWHNMGLVFPIEALEPHDPWITSSLDRWRHTYVEGLVPYPRQGEFWMLHNYNTINLSEAWLRRGEQAEALRDLYGLLLHTTATHGASEVVDSCGRRDLSSTPHNWFSAKLIRYVRDMLVYEGHDLRLHLLACLSPAWMRPGMRVAVHGAPTEYGDVSVEAAMRDGGMDVLVQVEHPVSMVLHTPPFITGVTASCGDVAGGDIVLPPASRLQVSVQWADRPLPDVSFASVAAAFVRDYEARRAMT